MKEYSKQEEELVVLAATEVKVYNQQKLDAFIKLHATDVTGFVLGSDEARFSGTAELKKLFSSLWEENPELRTNVIDELVNPPFVVLKHHVTGLHNGNEKKVIQILEFKNSLITRSWTTPY